MDGRDNGDQPVKSLVTLNPLRFAGLISPGGTSHSLELLLVSLRGRVGQVRVWDVFDHARDHVVRASGLVGGANVPCASNDDLVKVANMAHETRHLNIVGVDAPHHAISVNVLLLSSPVHAWKKSLRKCSADNHIQLATVDNGFVPSVEQSLEAWDLQSDGPGESIGIRTVQSTTRSMQRQMPSTWVAQQLTRNTQTHHGRVEVGKKVVLAVRSVDPVPTHDSSAQQHVRDAMSKRIPARTGSADWCEMLKFFNVRDGSDVQRSAGCRGVQVIAVRVPGSRGIRAQDVVVVVAARDVVEVVGVTVRN